MKFPIYLKVLCFFFLNLLVIIGILLFAARNEFGVGLDTLQKGRAGELFLNMANSISVELRNSERKNWNEILDRYESTHDFQLGIFKRNRGAQIGSIARPPKDIRIPPPFRNARPKERRPRERRNPPFDRNSQPPERRGPGGPPSQEESQNAEILVFTKSKRTGDFWAAARIYTGKSHRREAPYSILLLKAPSLSATGFTMDWRPWFWIIGSALSVSVLIWLPLVHSITRRLGTISNAAENIAQGQFEVDLQTSSRDEIGQLAQSIEKMAGKLDSHINGQKRFLGDIAHELCSPIARVRMGLELLDSKDGSQKTKRIAAIEEDMSDLSDLVNELLDFSKASIKKQEVRLTETDLIPIVQNLIEKETSADNVQLIAPDNLIIPTHPDLFRRSIGNVLRNAEKYAATHGPITVTLSQGKQKTTLLVEDNGPGIPEEWLEKIFDPFSRPDPSRTRSSGGSGLGLAIARTCLEGLNGTIHAENRKTGGLSVCIEIKH